MTSDVQKFMAEVKSKNAGEPEFHQAVQEVAESLTPVLERHPRYREARILEQIIEPEQAAEPAIFDDDSAATPELGETDWDDILEGQDTPAADEGTSEWGSEGIELEHNSNTLDTDEIQSLIDETPLDTEAAQEEEEASSELESLLMEGDDDEDIVDTSALEEELGLGDTGEEALAAEPGSLEQAMEEIRSLKLHNNELQKEIETIKEQIKPVLALLNKKKKPVR